MPPPDVMFEPDSTRAPVPPGMTYTVHKTYGPARPSLESRVSFSAALRALNRARGWDEFAKAKDALLALNSDVVMEVLETLQDPLPLTTQDVLKAFLVQHPHLNFFRTSATNPQRSKWQRIALVEVLTSFALDGSDQFADVVLAALREMLGHPEPAVIIAAAQGVTKLSEHLPAAQEAVRMLARHPNASVRAAVAEALEELGA